MGTGSSRLLVVLRRLTDAPVPVPRLPTTRPSTSRHSGRAPAITLSGVTFAYGPNSAPVVRDLDLTVPDGGHLAVVGPSGIGKSTLAALIAGVLTPARGHIALGAVTVGAADPCLLAGLRVLIPQEAYVFSATLRDNLGYLRTGTTPDEEITAAAHVVGMGPLLRELGGLDARITPARLSTGQRQLIALTRAYLSPAPVVLLDEATCHLDPAAEARAEHAFTRRPGTTLVVIAHRTASALRADRVRRGSCRTPPC